MKRVLTIVLVFILVIAGALIVYPRLRERVGDPEIRLENEGATVKIETTTEVEETVDEEVPEDAAKAPVDAKPKEPVADSKEDTEEPVADTTAQDAPKAPDFKVYDLEGKAVQYKSLVSDKPVLLNFWASWCPPCREEMPALQKLYDELGDEIEFLLINSTDGSRETPEKAKAYLKEYGFDMPVYLDQDGEASIIYGVSSLPTNILLGADGNIIGGVPGAMTEAQFRELFETYLGIA